MPKKRCIIAYVPVIHQGYQRFFEAFPKYQTLYVIGPDIIKETDYLRKDLRALKPSQAAAYLKVNSHFQDVKVISNKDLKRLNSSDFEIVMPDDDISRDLQKKLKKAKTRLYPVFLRWDRRSAEGVDQLDSSAKVTKSQLHQDFMGKAYKSASQSSDIWRRVGAVIKPKTGKTLFACNRGEPSEHSPWIEGDPRNVFNRGVAIEMSVFTHAEAALIAESAKHGIGLDGASIYVTTFPCPACAKLIAHSGIKKCYFSEGYVVLDGKRVLEDQSVDIIRVVSNHKDSTDKNAWVPYK